MSRVSSRVRSSFREEDYQDLPHSDVLDHSSSEQVRVFEKKSLPSSQGHSYQCVHASVKEDYQEKRERERVSDHVDRRCDVNQDIAN